MSYSQGSWPTEGDMSQGQFTDTMGGSPTSSEEQSFAFVGGYSQSEPYRRLPDRGNVRQPSSSPTSSLSGAMGEARISHPQLPTVPTGMPWSMPQGSFTSDEQNLSSFISAPPTPASASPSGTFASYQYSSHYNSSNYGNSNLETFPTHASASSPFAEQHFAAQQAQARAMLQPSIHSSSPVVPSTGVPIPMPQNATSSSSRSSRPPSDWESYALGLERRVRELETRCHFSEQHASQLQQELARAYPMAGTAGGPLPSPFPTPSASPAMLENWRRRTEARKRIFCSLNRAGNALCAWHDSRRERRTYPPRNAPPGMLNCGCTFEEALFEESLSRRGVGSYHPGESVRMDPALRNPLLKLLQERYGYRDGDFDRDPITGNWIDGEDAAYWEAKLAAGAASARKTRGEERR
ncbi:hypothetical protein WOLCODRAFT_145266 [Wolfiporia cocos MD-104 SS10]|uniref:Uncharacterized protein n=1 Tax=Wolfiporia cocos (strain MD-104) TaxID=742152 RepID=A0A2H3JSP1_WOLCO|nr:hypothetical protein WOLCODRAFT_145266 [Wolfiporia cocos MD-104 SS10]